MKRGQGDGSDFYKTSKFDLVVIGLILFLAAASLLRITRNNIRSSSEKRAAMIYQNGRLLEEVKLEKDEAIPILNGRMRLEVKKGKIRVLNSDCPQHICMNMGWIQYSGQTIVCVPNKVLIEITSAAPSLLDAVSY